MKLAKDGTGQVSKGEYGPISLAGRRRNRLGEVSYRCGSNEVHPLVLARLWREDGLLGVQSKAM